MHLHFGPARRPGRSQPKNEVAARWVLNTCGTNWQLFSDGGMIESPRKQDMSLDSKLTNLLKSRTVRQAGIINGAKWQLFVLFNNSCLFLISPSADDDKYDDVPYWELLLPNHQVVEVGPGRKWSFKRSDKPAA